MACLRLMTLDAMVDARKSFMILAQPLSTMGLRLGPCEGLLQGGRANAQRAPQFDPIERRVRAPWPIVTFELAIR